MEDGLVQVVQHLFRYSSYVLILVVVDNGLVPSMLFGEKNGNGVLILVVMEDGLVLPI